MNNQSDVNTLKMCGFGGNCISPGCTERITDPSSPTCRVMELQHVAEKLSVVCEGSDGKRHVLIEPKKTAFGHIARQCNNATFVARIMGESTKVLPLCKAHHMIVDQLLNQNLVRSTLNYQEDILLPDGTKVNGFLILEDNIDATITEVLDSVELVRPGYVEDILRRSRILKLAIPPNYVAPVPAGGQPPNAAGDATLGDNNADVDGRTDDGASDGNTVGMFGGDDLIPPNDEVQDQDGTLGGNNVDIVGGNDDTGVIGFDYGDGNCNGDGDGELNGEEQANGNAENVPPNDQWLLPTPEVHWTLRNGSTLVYRPTKKHRTCLSKRN